MKCTEIQWRIDQQSQSTLDDLSLVDVVNGDGHDPAELQWGKYVDDRSGRPLRTDMVIKARRKEIATLEEMKVYEKVPRSMVKARGFKVVQTRWLDIDKVEPGERARCEITMCCEGLPDKR